MIIKAHQRQLVVILRKKEGEGITFFKLPCSGCGKKYSPSKLKEYKEVPLKDKSLCTIFCDACLKTLDEEKQNFINLFQAENEYEYISKITKARLSKVFNQ